MNRKQELAARVQAITGASNKQTVLAFYDLAFNKHKPQEAVDKYVGPEYIQHNPTFPDGAAAFVKAVSGFKGKVEFKQVFTDGNFVILHSNLGPGTAVVDIFRLENGKIVEHWDVTQKIPAKSANDNGMF